jgi:hypothetical protein
LQIYGKLLPNSSAQTKANVITFVKKIANKNEYIYLQGLIESKPVQNTRNHYATEERGKHKSHSYNYCVDAHYEKK